MKWVWLFASIVCEVIGTTLLKLSSHGDRNANVYASGTFAFYVACFWLFWKAMKFFSLGAVYATWSGVSVSLVAIIGLVWFGDEISPLKLLSFAMVIAGVVGLNMSDVSH